MNAYIITLQHSAGSIRETRERRARLKSGDYLDDYRPGFDPRDPELLAAFNEGAGI